MANVNTPFGFRPTMRTFTGGSGTIQPTHKLAGYATALFINDAVTHAAAGTKPTLAVDAAITPGTTPVLGVNLIYQAASVATDGAIIMAAGAIFQAQGDGTGATFLVATEVSEMECFETRVTVLPAVIAMLKVFCRLAAPPTRWISRFAAWCRIRPARRSAPSPSTSWA